MTIADAPPPPLQIAAAPILALCCFKIEVNAMTILAQETPKGCPRDTAPPFTFTFLSLRPKIFIFAKPTTENASFNSKKSTSFIEIFAFAKAFGKAFAGAVVNHLVRVRHPHNF